MDGWSPDRRFLLAAVLGGFAVQAFHMVEHVVQVWQVYVAEGEDRSGIVGARADTEWVHLVFNTAVLAFLVLVWWAARPSGLVTRRSSTWLVAATVVQGYHLAEHVAKVVQHEVRGLRVGPGLLGDDLGLVWFHYGVNLAVFAGTVVAVTHMALPVARARLAGVRLPARRAAPATAPSR